MKTQLTLAVIIVSLTVVGLATLPTVYHLATAVFGFGCASLALAFAGIIWHFDERKAYRPKRVRSTYLPPTR